MTLSLDTEYGLVIGVDEAGRGPLAGPVVAAAVFIKYIDKENRYIQDLADVNDSKKLSEKKREVLYPKILNNSFVGIGIVDVEDIDRLNILGATMKAMKIAVERLKIIMEQNGVKEDIVLVDGNMCIKDLNIQQKAIIQGDSKSLSIAAASIIAKVTRDNIMREIDKKYPLYLFHKHKGYGTKEHIDRIKEYGISDIHRKSFLTKLLD